MSRSRTGTSIGIIVGVGVASIQRNAVRRREDFESRGRRDRAFHRISASGDDSNGNAEPSRPGLPVYYESVHLVSCLSAVNENRSMREFLRFHGTRDAQKRHVKREHGESRGEMG